MSSLCYINRGLNTPIHFCININSLCILFRLSIPYSLFVQLFTEEGGYGTYLSGGIAELRAVDIVLQIRGYHRIDSLSLVEEGKAPTKVNLSGNWVNTPRNPALWLRNRYGPGKYTIYLSLSSTSQWKQSSQLPIIHETK